MTVIHSTISNNSTIGWGGGIANYCTLRIGDSTISANNATRSGGGIGLFGGSMALSYTTIAANTGAIANLGGTSTVTGTLIANSTGFSNCSGPYPLSQGYNLDSDGSCGLATPTDISNTNPQLGALADNGGATQTMALLPGSPAIDHGGTRANGCPAADQRGMPRPDEVGDTGTCDIGAYESQGVQ
jgi:hypothetical protein